MEKLPLELICHIVLYADDWSRDTIWRPKKLSRSQFISLATIGPLWKDAEEKITFCHLNLQSDRLDVFRSTVTGARRRYAQSIYFAPSLPRQSFEARARAHSEEAYCNRVGGVT